MPDLMCSICQAGPFKNANGRRGHVQLSHPEVKQAPLAADSVPGPGPDDSVLVRLEGLVTDALTLLGEIPEALEARLAQQTPTHPAGPLKLTCALPGRAVNMKPDYVSPDSASTASIARSAASICPKSGIQLRHSPSASSSLAMVSTSSARSDRNLAIRSDMGD